MPNNGSSSSSNDPENIIHDPITAEEIEGAEPPAPPNKRPNAFTELMSASKKPKPQSSSPINTLKKAVKRWDPRDGLGIYIEKPETNPEGRVVEYDDDFVVINDKYPKASVHLLLLPRNPSYIYKHPLDLLSSNPTLLSEIRTRVSHLETLVATELRRQYGLHSASDAPYQSALEDLMSSPDPPLPPPQRAAMLPKGRDWSKDVIAGVHTHPSMNHLHIHIMSRDMHSPWLKHKKHYLSFNSSFLVGLEDLPLEDDSPRRHPGDWPKWDMKCWRCGKNFGNKFAALKEHLAEEFEKWKIE